MCIRDSASAPRAATAATPARAAPPGAPGATPAPTPGGARKSARANRNNKRMTEPSLRAKLRRGDRFFEDIHEPR